MITTNKKNNEMGGEKEGLQEGSQEGKAGPALASPSGVPRKLSVSLERMDVSVPVSSDSGGAETRPQSVTKGGRSGLRSGSARTGRAGPPLEDGRSTSEERGTEAAAAVVSSDCDSVDSKPPMKAGEKRKRGRPHLQDSGEEEGVTPKRVTAGRKEDPLPPPAPPMRDEGEQRPPSSSQEVMEAPSAELTRGEQRHISSIEDYLMDYVHSPLLDLAATIYGEMDQVWRVARSSKGLRGDLQGALRRASCKTRAAVQALVINRSAGANREGEGGNSPSEEIQGLKAQLSSAMKRIAELSEEVLRLKRDAGRTPTTLVPPHAEEGGD